MELKVERIWSPLRTNKRHLQISVIGSEHLFHTIVINKMPDKSKRYTILGQHFYHPTLDMAIESVIDLLYDQYLHEKHGIERKYS